MKAKDVSIFSYIYDHKKNLLFITIVAEYKDFAITTSLKRVQP
jgi:hypothetical protein